MLLQDPEEADRRSGEQLIQSHLEIGAHLARELARSGDQPVRRYPGKVPSQSLVGVFELLVLRDLRELSGGALNAVVTDQRAWAFEEDRLAFVGAALFARLAAEGAVMGFLTAAFPAAGIDGLGGQFQTMALGGNQ